MAINCLWTDKEQGQYFLQYINVTTSSFFKQTKISFATLISCYNQWITTSPLPLYRKSIGFNVANIIVGEIPLIVCW
jgi:hypothetical protein